MADSVCCHVVGGLRRVLVGTLVGKSPGNVPAPEAAADAPTPSAAAPLVARGQGANAVAGGLSMNQLKRQRAMEIKRERKGQKKVQRQLDGLQAALAALEQALPEALPDAACSANAEHGDSLHAAGFGIFGDHGSATLGGRLCGAFRSRPRYRALPVAFGPRPRRGIAAVAAVLLRPPKYAEKFLPQEYSLLHKLWSVLRGDCAGAGVLDIGAGNANCAALAAALLGLTVICVERESPREELRAEAQLPDHLRRRVIRVEADVADFGAAQLTELALAHGLRRIVIVAKHPCGIGADRSIDCAAQLRAACSRDGDACAIVGVVLATCCTNKISLDDFKESRVREFCTMYSGDVPLFGGVDPEACERTSPSFDRAVEIMSRCSGWRSAAGSLGNAISGEQIEWAELFEDALQSLRLRKLEHIFGAACEVRFAPSACTLQDRCLLATSRPLPESIWAHGDADDKDSESFLIRLEQSGAELLGSTGPIDCRPRGLKSARYEFDYTDGVSPPGADSPVGAPGGAG